MMAMPSPSAFLVVAYETRRSVRKRTPGKVWNEHSIIGNAVSIISVVFQERVFFFVYLVSGKCLYIHCVQTVENVLLYVRIIPL